MQEEIRFVTSLSLWNNLKHDTEFSSQPVKKIHDGKTHTVRRWVQATVTESTKNPTLGSEDFLSVAEQNEICSEPKVKVLKMLF